MKHAVYNDDYVADDITSMPKKIITNYKTMAELEAFLKDGFNVPADQPVKLTFKNAAGPQKNSFWSNIFKEQLSLAVAFHLDDV